jgi:uncharacterized protein (UPF0548 family)
MSDSGRRSNFSNDRPVSYGSVGATQAADVLIFPPAGFASTEDEYRLGSGQERFNTAVSSLMTWGVLSGSDIDIVSIDEAHSEGYTGLMFNEFGAPMPPADDSIDQLFGPDGTPYLSAGTSIVLANLWTPFNIEVSFRVIYVVREERRYGYALGTLDAAPVVGEEFFSVEWRDDDSVWFVLRAVTAIAEERKFSYLTALIRFRQLLQRRQYIRALLPVRSA